MNSISPIKYSIKSIDKAAKFLCNLKEDYKDLSETSSLNIDIVNNWRGAHNYPLSIFIKRLRRVSQNVDEKAICSQRLKRIPSILKKLRRSYFGNNPTMRYTQMQDIAGCRVVLSTLKKVNTLYSNYYLKNKLKHKKVNEKNYILEPKSDGYRCIHLVYKFVSDKTKKEYNDLLVEIQIRSKLQHLWATAVETVDFFTKQAIKSSQGDKEWVDFFRLVSSAFAIYENTPLVKNTPTDEKELFLLIKKKEKELQVISKMKNWTKSIKSFDDLKNNKKKVQYFLLELDTILEKLNISVYSKKEEEKALLDYAKAEKKIYGRLEYDVVLVGVDNLVDLKKAYPNYFLDTADFITRLERIIKKY